jgi:hypothetical protein
MFVPFCSMNKKERKIERKKKEKKIFRFFFFLANFIVVIRSNSILTLVKYYNHKTIVQFDDVYCTSSVKKHCQ